MKVYTTEHCHLYKDTHHQAPHRQRYGLALTSESGQGIGERPTTDMWPQFSLKRAVTPDIPAQSICTFASKSRKTPLVSRSESLSKSHVVDTRRHLGRPSPPLGSTSTVQGSADWWYPMENNAVPALHILPNAASWSQGEIFNRCQLLGNHKEVSCLHVTGI